MGERERFLEIMKDCHGHPEKAYDSLIAANLIRGDEKPEVKVEEIEDTLAKFVHVVRPDYWSSVDCIEDRQIGTVADAIFTLLQSRSMPSGGIVDKELLLSIAQRFHDLPIWTAEDLVKSIQEILATEGIEVKP